MVPGWLFIVIQYFNREEIVNSRFFRRSVINNYESCFNTDLKIHFIFLVLRVQREQEGKRVIRNYLLLGTYRIENSDHTDDQFQLKTSFSLSSL